MTVLRLPRLLDRFVWYVLVLLNRPLGRLDRFELRPEVLLRLPRLLYTVRTCLTEGDQHHMVFVLVVLWEAVRYDICHTAWNRMDVNACSKHPHTGPELRTSTLVGQPLALRLIPRYIL